MLRSSGMKFSMGTSNVGGTGRRSQAGAEVTGRSGASLAQLESVLQRLNKHDERAQIQRVEWTSTQAQHKLLREELLKAQEELALAHTGKNKLCEEIGALQQAKHDQHTQIEHLLVELRSSRESHVAMAKKVAELEEGSQDLKRLYIRSLTCRVKTSNELLSRLHVAGAFDHGAELSKAIVSKCDDWIQSEPNKRKRVVGVPQPSVVEDCVIGDDSMEGQSPIDTSTPSGSSLHDECVANFEKTSETADSATTIADHKLLESKLEDLTKAGNHDECKACIELELMNSNLKEAAENEIAAAKSTLEILEARNCDLNKTHEQARARMSALSELIEEKDGAIGDLKKELEMEKEKAMQSQKSLEKPADAKAKEDDGDSSGRIKVLEDNLAQLNTYADHLEMLISQCASCSVKLQSENTQASVSSESTF